MPPQVALIICTIFVLWLLRLDHKQAPDVSLALWIPTIWMLINISKPLGVWFESGNASVEEGSPLDRTVLIALFCIGLIILVIRRFDWSTAISKNVWLMMLLGYMLVSILWSDIPFVSFKRWTRELTVLVMSFLIATESEPRQAVQSLFRRIIYILIPFSYVVIHYFPKYGREYNPWTGDLMWIGVATQKNGLGILCIFAAFFLIWSFIRRRQGKDTPATKYQTYLEALIFILTLWLMGGPQHSFSYSATSNATFIFGLSILIGLSLIKKKGTMIELKALIVIVVFIIVYGTVTPFVGKLSLVDISSILGRNSNLTGRNEIWAILTPLAMKRPILGYGFGGFWTTDAIQEVRGIQQSHCGYLDILLNLGLIGHIFFSMFLLSCCRKAQREMIENFDWGSFFICFLLMALVHNISESSSFGITGKFSAVVLILSVTSITDRLNNQMGWRKVRVGWEKSTLKSESKKDSGGRAKGIPQGQYAKIFREKAGK